MSGAKLVIIIFAGLAVVVAIVLTAFLLFEPESAPCASGELAENRLRDGRYENRVESFETVGEAEAFICHGVPELKAEGWTLQSIHAERNVPLEFLVEGQGIGVVTLNYVNDQLMTTLSLDFAPHFELGPSYFESLVPENSTTEPVEVQGTEATVYRFGINPDAVSVIWQANTLDHQARTQLSPQFTLDDLLETLETLE